MLDLFGTHFFSNICLILAKRLTISPFVPLRVWHTLTKGKQMKSTAISYEKVNFDHTMSDVWNSSDPFVYTMHTTCGMTLKTLGWERPSTHGERQRPVSEYYWCVLVKRTYHGAITRRNLLDVSHLSFTLSVRLSFLSFPFPNYPSHLFSYFPPSVYLSFLPSLSLTKFHYI